MRNRNIKPPLIKLEKFDPPNHKTKESGQEVETDRKHKCKQRTTSFVRKAHNVGQGMCEIKCVALRGMPWHSFRNYFILETR